MSDRKELALKCAKHIVSTQKRDGYRDSWYGGESNLACDCGTPYEDATHRELCEAVRELRHRAERMGRAIESVKALRLHPLTCDGENGAEVDAYHDGYKDALRDMHDTLDASAGEP